MTLSFSCIMLMWIMSGSNSDSDRDEGVASTPKPIILKPKLICMFLIGQWMAFPTIEISTDTGITGRDTGIDMKVLQRVPDLEALAGHRTCAVTSRDKDACL